jgi:hypothetical protein
MTDPRVVDATVLGPVLRTLARIDWPVPVDEVPHLVASLGWTVVPGTEGRSLRALTGWALDGAAADFSSDRLGLATVSFGATDDVLDDSPWRGRLLRDAFAVVAGVAAAEFGAPTGGVPRPDPQAWWDLPGGGRIEIGVGATSVTVGAYSAEYADEVRGLDAPAG